MSGKSTTVVIILSLDWGVLLECGASGDSHAFMAFVAAFSQAGQPDKLHLRRSKGGSAQWSLDDVEGGSRF